MSSLVVTMSAEQALGRGASVGECARGGCVERRLRQQAKAYGVVSLWGSADVGILQGRLGDE